MSNPLLPRPRGKVASTPTKSGVSLPKISAERFARMQPHEKTEAYFSASVDYVWQARFHNDFRRAFNYFEEELSRRDNANRRGEDE